MTLPEQSNSDTFLLDDGLTTIAAHTLSALQLDGIACIWCDRCSGHMMPAGYGPRGQVFEHTPSCPSCFLDRCVSRASKRALVGNRVSRS